MSGKKLSLWAFLLIAAALVGWYRVKAFSDLEPVSGQVPKIVVVTGGSGPYWQLAAQGAKDAGKEHGVEVQVEMPEEAESVGHQTQLLIELNGENLGGVAISPLNAEGQTRLINELADHVNVVTFDSDASLSERQCYVGTSNFSAGKMCGRLVREALPEGGKVAVLMANQTKANLIERRGGLSEALYLASEVKEPTGEDEESEKDLVRYEIVEYLVDEGNLERAAELIRETLEEHPDLNCFVGLNARHGPVLLEVLEEEGKLGEIQLVTFDEAEETLKGVEEGHIYATIAQDPYMYGYQSVRILHSLYGGDDTTLPIVGRGSIYVGAEAIYQEDVEAFRKKLQERMNGATAKKTPADAKDAA